MTSTNVDPLGLIGIFIQDLYIYVLFMLKNYSKGLHKLGLEMVGYILAQTLLNQLFNFKGYE